MTPDLMEAGAQRYEKLHTAALQGQTESGGRSAGYGRVAKAGEVDTTHGRILYLEDVHVSFDGFKAINGLNLDIAPGELRCIIGPNGAGKTTMMDIITGKTRPDSGTVFFGSTIDLLRYREPEIAALGIGRKFQKPTVFEQLSVFENLELALATDKRVGHSMVFSLTGCGLSVAGRAPARRMLTRASTSVLVKLPEIWPESRMADRTDAADMISPSRTMASCRLPSRSVGGGVLARVMS